MSCSFVRMAAGTTAALALAALLWLASGLLDAGGVPVTAQPAAGSLILVKALAYADGDPTQLCQQAVANNTTTLVVGAGAPYYLCYAITNNSSEPVVLQTLFDDQETIVVGWQPGQTLSPGVTLLPTATNGLIRSATATQTTVSVARWTVEEAGVLRRVESAPTSLQIVTAQISVALTVGDIEGTCSPTTTANLNYVLSGEYPLAYYCLRITNQGPVTLTQHLVNIPALQIVDQPLAATIGPQGSITVQSVNTSLAPWSNQLRQRVDVASITVRATVLSMATNGLQAANEGSATVTGLQPVLYVRRNIADRPDRCDNDRTEQRGTGYSGYYCVIIENRSAAGLVPLSQHELSESATGRSVTLRDATIVGGERLVITNQYLASRGLPTILGPVTYPSGGTFQTSSRVVSSHPERGFRVENNAQDRNSFTVLKIVTPQPPTPTTTSTPQPTWTPVPTWTPIPVPPTWTPVPTWTLMPTPTPSPTFFVVTTPGGFPNIASPQTGAVGAVDGTPNPFQSPLGLPVLDAQTATAAALSGQPYYDPPAQTATAALFYGQPPVDVPAQTATAAVFYGQPPVDVPAQTATAALFYGQPPVDVPAQTATAAVFYGQPPVDAPAQTATAAVFYGQPPVDVPAQTATPIPEGAPPQTATPAVAAAPPQTVEPAAGVVPVPTATPTATPTAAVQRPLTSLAPAPVDGLAIFRSIAGGTVAALAVLAVLAGAVLFLMLTGMLAGFSIFRADRSSYHLTEQPDGQSSLFQAAGRPVSSEEETEWPSSLP